MGPQFSFGTMLYVMKENYRAPQSGLQGQESSPEEVTFEPDVKAE